jgi:hypothetical protein
MLNERLERLEATVKTLLETVEQYKAPFRPKRSASAPPAVELREQERELSPLEYCPHPPPSSSSGPVTTNLPSVSDDVPVLAPATQSHQSPALLTDHLPALVPEIPDNAVQGHPGVKLVPATPLNSQDSANTHLTLVTPAPAPVVRPVVPDAVVPTALPMPMSVLSPLEPISPVHTPLPITQSQTQVTLPVPDGPALGTRSQSRSRSVMSMALDVPRSPPQTRSRSRSRSDGSNMDLNEPKRGHKCKASDTSGA